MIGMLGDPIEEIHGDECIDDCDACPCWCHGLRPEPTVSKLLRDTGEMEIQINFQTSHGWFNTGDRLHLTLEDEKICILEITQILTHGTKVELITRVICRHCNGTGEEGPDEAGPNAVPVPCRHCQKEKR